jgi:hypothetical protein
MDYEGTLFVEKLYGSNPAELADKLLKQGMIVISITETTT